VELGDTLHGFADLRQAVALDPANNVTYVIFASALSKMGRHQEALVDDQQAFALNPGSSQNLNGLGTSLYRVGRYQEALEPLRKSCELARYPHYCAEYALALLRAGKRREGEKVARDAGKLPENDWGFLHSRAILVGRRGPRNRPTIAQAIVRA
jgi:Tfp pilus assembly protein PilF